MKKCFAFILALVLLLTATAALADGRPAPEDKKVITNSDFGVETLYKKYDNKFYDGASEQPGEVVRVDYTTDAYGAPKDGWVNVYVPYGYDATKKYNIIYFLHGTNENQDSFIGDERVKNALDNMIEVGKAEPFLMVFPTYYYDYVQEDVSKRSIDIPGFRDEMRNDIMPAVESQFSTYADTADDAGFAASRDHRAISGYSRGSYATWHMLNGLLDLAKWWIPMSAAISGEAEMEVPGPGAEEQVAWLTAAIESQPDYQDDFFIYLACGSKRDDMYDVVTGLAKAMADSGKFSYGMNPAENNWFFTISGEAHQTLLSRFYFYNAFDILFK